MITLSFENFTTRDVDETIFQKTLDAATSHTNVAKRFKDKDAQKGEGSMTLSLTLIDDAEMQKVNKKHRDKDEPTDVLSFSYLDQPEGDDLVGEVLISLETAQVQAGEYGHSLETELKKLFVHAILHIVGYDHETDQEEADMEVVATDILATCSTLC